MINQILQYFLPLYFVLYFGVAFVGKSLMVAKKIGKSPEVLPKDDSVFGLVGRYFRYTLIALGIYVAVWSLVPVSHTWLMPLPVTEAVQWVGIGLMVIAFILTVLAQHHMRLAWRIGIDQAERTELITNGLFAWSRNPIFLSMSVSLIGVFLATPNAVTLAILILGIVLMQIQIRLEEVHLLQSHGQAYQSYMNRVRRWI
jgi:protein-S-isoprenylcysteine O-methyltransferase Ste14